MHPFQALLIGAVAVACAGAYADDFPAFIGRQPVPSKAPFEAKGGTLECELAFTPTWVADYGQRWPRDKPAAEPGQIQGRLATLNIPLKIYFPHQLEEGRRYPLFIGNFTEFKDSRGPAGAYAGKGNAAGYVVAGFCLTEELMKQSWCDEKFRAGICLYVASTIARWAPIDPNRIYVGGHSGGSKVSLGYLSCYPSDYAGVMVLGCNQVVFFDENRAMPAAIQAKGVALFCGTGAKDAIATPGASKAVFELLKASRFPYALYGDHDGGHAVVDAQNLQAFEFFNTSYADWFAKSQAEALRSGLSALKAKRYGDALFPLLKVASFNPGTDNGKKAQAGIDAIDLARHDAEAAAATLVEQGKKPEAKRQLLDMARRFQGSWYQFDLQELAAAIAK
jgi:pimeloyl-ACP methyl ester carboxylesterase